jgi:hypothetical protein
MEVTDKTYIGSDVFKLGVKNKHKRKNIEEAINVPMN